MKKFFIVLLLAGLLLPLYSADFNFYGDFRLGTWFERYDCWTDDTVKYIVDSSEIDTIIFLDTFYIKDTTGVITGSDSLPMNYCSFIPNGYLGLQFKTERLDIVVETGVSKNLYDGRNSTITSNRFLARRNHFFFMRKWYVNWHINDYFSLLFGKDNSPVNYVPSNQGYYSKNSFSNTGCVDGGRNPMIQFKAGNASSIAEGIQWEAKVAALNPDTTYFPLRGNKDVDVGIKAPKFESSANIGFSNGNFEILGELCYGFQRYYLSSPLSKPVDSCEGNVDAYVVGGHLKFKVGIFSIDWTGAFGNNLGNYGLHITNQWVWFGGANKELVEVFYAIWPPGEDIKNSFAKEMAIILKLNFLDRFRVEWGGGIVNASHDDEAFTRKWHNTLATYLQIDIKILEALYITPEIGDYFYGPEIGYGNRFYAGFQVGAEL